MLIGKTKLDEQKVIELISDIKKKKELKEISDDFVREELFNYFKQNLKKSFSFNQKSKQYKETLKKVRAKLRRVYGLFRNKIDYTKSEPEILQAHSSTKERLAIYNKLYHEIFKITKKPKTILDLGCGVNPLSIKYMKIKPTYYAYDLSKEEVKAINQFFKKNEISGKAQVKDILTVKQFPQADLAFLFKMTDVLDQGKGHKTTEKVIKLIPAKFVVVSFPTKTMSGKKMNFPRRKWIELMCERLGYTYNLIEFNNELFYVIKK